MDAMLRSMTSKQLREWLAFSELEPFDGTDEAVRSGAIEQILRNVYRDTKRRKTPFELSDCVLGGGDNPLVKGGVRKKQTWQEMKAVTKSIFGG